MQAARGSNAHKSGARSQLQNTQRAALRYCFPFSPLSLYFFFFPWSCCLLVCFLLCPHLKNLRHTLTCFRQNNAAIPHCICRLYRVILITANGVGCCVQEKHVLCHDQSRRSFSERTVRCEQSMRHPSPHTLFANLLSVGCCAGSKQKLNAGPGSASIAGREAPPSEAIRNGQNWF